MTEGTTRTAACIAIWWCGFVATDALASDGRMVDHFPEAAKSGCMKCHAGIEPIREPGSEMLRQIMERVSKVGDPAGCVVCHGGDPSVTDDKTKAHRGVEHVSHVLEKDRVKDGHVQKKRAPRIHSQSGESMGQQADVRAMSRASSARAVAQSPDFRS